MSICCAMFSRRLSAEAFLKMDVRERITPRNTTLSPTLLLVLLACLSLAMVTVVAATLAARNGPASGVVFSYFPPLLCRLAADSLSYVQASTMMSFRLGYAHHGAFSRRSTDTVFTFLELGLARYRRSALGRVSVLAA
jgi:hypothetical protein